MKKMMKLMTVGEQRKKMRELKFRVWLKNYNHYAEVLGFDWGELIVHLQRDELVEHRLRVPLEDCILEQYTGLKDKNGKEIYEGDIVRWVDDYDENAYINFDEGCFWVNWPINSERINGDMVDDLEVIGNIHENADLLKEGK